MTKTRGFAIFVVVVVTLTFIAGTTLFAIRVAEGQQLDSGIDYKTLATNQEKLAACERLIYEAIQEYNAQSQYAAARNASYILKFRAYTQTFFRATIEPLLLERATLRESIREGSYSAKAWEAVSQLPWPEQEAILAQLYGNKTAHYHGTTVATYGRLAELYHVVLDDISGVGFTDPVEDFTTYTEVDPGSDITIDSNTVTCAGVDTRDDSFWVYSDKGVNHFDGDFEHRQLFYADSSASGVFYTLWMLANAIGDEKDLTDASESYLQLRYYHGGGGEMIYLRECDSGSGYADGFAANQDELYYLTTVRDDDDGSYGSLTCYVCTVNYYGESGSVLEDTLTLSLHSSKKDFRYVYVASGYDDSSGPDLFSGYVEDLDLQEVSCPELDTLATDDIEDTTATLNGNVTAVNDSTIDDRGFVWGTTSNATTPGCAEAPEDTNYDSYWTEAGTFGVGVFDHGITGLATATTHYARAAANNSDGNWGWGDEVSWLTKPAAPTNVAASDGSDTAKVVVTWTKSSGTITGYKIYRDAGLIDTVGDVATYDDTGADAPTITPGSGVASDGTYGDKVNLSVSGDSANVGSTHTYKVRAYNAAGDSDDSATDTGYRGVGSLTYQWYVSWNCSAGNYSQIGGGTTDPYDYMNAPAPTITANNTTACDGCSGVHVTLSCNETTADGTCNYYLAELSATGASSQNCTSDSGYKGATAQTFQWWRSWNATAGNYSQIAGGTTDPYNDTGGATTPDYRWYLTTISMTGATSVNSSADSGYMSGVNVTAVYVYPAYDQEPTSTNQSVWCIVWDDEGLGVGYNVTWNTSGVGSILWCENWTGADGRADLICTSNATGNQTICAESNGFSDCGLTLWTQGTGEELPVWYFVLLGCAIVGAWYTKDIILFIMGIVASGGMIYWVEQSSLDDRIRYALIAVFVILAGVLLLQMLIRGQFSFVRGGDSE